MQSTRLIRSLFKKQGLRYATQAAVKEVQGSGSVEVTRLPSGVVVASIDNQAPVSRVAIAYRAGARNETEDNLGVSHCMRILADQSTAASSGFGLVRGVQQQGASLNVLSTRELTMYNLNCLRDGLDSVQEMFVAAATAPAFKDWEVADQQGRIALDLALLQNNPDAVLNEALHKVAFKDTLGRSLCAPKYMVGKFSSEMLQDYAANNLTAGRCAVLAVGLEHTRAVELGRALELPGGHGQPQKASHYSQGEVRMQTGGSLARVAIGVQGASGGSSESLALAVLQHALGALPSIKYCSGQSPLTTAVGAVANNPFLVAADSASYSDNGLFSVSLLTHAEDAGKAVQAAYSVMKNASQKLTEQDVKRAKTQLKSQLLFEEESGDSRLRGLAAGALLSQVDASQIDSLATSDVLAAAKKLAGAPSLAAVGNLKSVPCLHELK